jgi:uncharacterized protein YktA (UPF0223 family)
MESNPNPLFSAEKMAAAKAAYAEYSRLKADLLSPIVKCTTGKMNTLDGQSAREWYPFAAENPDWITNKLKLPDFKRTLDADTALAAIEALENKEQGATKAKRNIVSSDLRYFWTTAETFYDDAAADNAEIKERYKSLPSISPQRQSDTQVEQAFNKLTEKRNRKNGASATPPIQ